MISLSDFKHEHPKASIAVSIKELGLTYKTSIEKKPTLKARIKTLGRGKKHTRIVRAVDGISLDIHYGSVLGVIGSNGAGKSTLMRVISGIIPPTEGRVDDCKVITSSSSERLDQAACEHVTRVWRWQPPTNAGVPVAVSTRVSVKWDLKDAR